MPTKRKKQNNNRRFLRNVLIGVIALIIVAFIINIAPGYKRDKYANVTNLVITDTNVTEKLKHKIYINENGTVYISQDDIKELIDKTIFYDESSNVIIVTSDASAASMQVGEKTIKINGANIQVLDTAMYIENVLYIPISEMEDVYNINVKYIDSTDTVVIDNLNAGMITAEVSEETVMKFRPRGMSKNIEKLMPGQRIYAFYTTSKGWRLIRTEDGKIGYVKANTLTNEYIVRHDMKIKNETQKISLNIQDNSTTKIENTNITVKDLLVVSNEGITLKEAMSIGNNAHIWANLSNNSNLDFTNYNTRTELIDNIVSISYTYNLKGININFNGNEKGLDRLVIELAPRLREMGIVTNIVMNENIKEDTYKDVVDYLITKQ